MTTTWNPSDLNSCTLSGGNLIATGGAGAGGVRSTTSNGSGKFHLECTITHNAANDTGCGISVGAASFSGLVSNASGGVVCFTDYIGGRIYIDGSYSGTSLGTASDGDVVAIEIDIGGELIWLALNAGNWNNNALANPATGIGGLSFSTLTGPFFALATVSNFGVVTGNFGASAFSRTPSSGFAAWDTGGPPTLPSSAMFFAGD